MSEYESLFRPDSPISTSEELTSLEHLDPFGKLKIYISWINDMKEVENWKAVLKGGWALCYDFKDKSRWGENPSISDCISAIIRDMNTVDKNNSEEDRILYHFMNAMCLQMTYSSLLELKRKNKIDAVDNNFTTVFNGLNESIEELKR